MKDFNVIMNSESEVRYKPTGGHIFKNDGIATQWNPPALGTEGKYKMGVLIIPKNASSSMKNLIWMNTHTSHQKWSDPANLIDLSKHWKNLDDIIVVLRDPYERFMSAINMFLSVSPNESHIMKCDINQKEVTLLNEHVYSQSYYLEDVLASGPQITNKLRYFYMSNTNDVTRDIVKCFPKLVRIEDPSINIENKSVPIVTGVNKELIRKIYKQDFDLIENTEFMNSEKISFNKGE